MRTTGVLLFVLLMVPLGAFAAGGTVMAFGGLNVPQDGVKMLVTLSGGANGVIAVGPWAGTAESAETLAEALRAAGAGTVRVLPADTSRLSGPQASALLKGVNAVVFSDGDPHRLARVLKGSAFLRTLRTAHETGGVVAAVGRASAALSETMLDLSPPDMVPSLRAGRFTSNGLGLLAASVIAPGVTEQGQLPHLTAVVTENAWLLGIGVEDGTAIAVRDGVLEVFGQGTVVVIDPFQASVRKRKDGALSARGILSHTLLAGEKYNLRKRVPLPRPF